MTDEFSKLPVGNKFKKGNITGGIVKKLTEITRYGESSIIHDKVDVISKVLGRYDSYIRRGGLNRFQRLAAVRDIKKMGDLSKAEYQIVKKLVENYSSSNKVYTKGKSDEARKKMLAKQSGIRSRIEDYDKDFDNESENRASALSRRYGSSGFATQTASGKSRVSAVQRDEGSFNPFRFAKEKGSRSSIRKKLRSGEKMSNKDFQKVAVSALSGEKGSSARIGVDKPTTGFTFSSKSSPASSATKSNFSKKPLGF